MDFWKCRAAALFGNSGGGGGEEVVLLLRMNQHSLGRGRGSEGRGEGGEKGAALSDGNFFDKVLPCGSIKSFSPAPFPLPRLEARATPATRKPRAQAGSGRTSAHAPRGRYMAATSPAPEPRTRHNAGVWLLVLGPHGSGSPGTACGGGPWVWQRLHVVWHGRTSEAASMPLMTVH